MNRKFKNLGQMNIFMLNVKKINIFETHCGYHSPIYYIYYKFPNSDKN